MFKRILICFITSLFLLFCKPIYSLEASSVSIEKYLSQISNKFSKTYCNTIKFGISDDGALAFAIGETNKEFKNNKLNFLIDYPALKNNIVNSLRNGCQIYDFPVEKLADLDLN